MVFDTDIIKRSFSKAASTYDEFSGFQKDVAFEVFQRLSQMLQQREHAFLKAASIENRQDAFTFLDIGSGTGRLAALVNSIPGAKVFASDIALTMLCKAREKHGNSFGLATGDCCYLPFRDGVFDMLGPSTLWELRDCYKAHRAVEFKDSTSIESALKASGLEVVAIEASIIKRRYGSFIELLKALKNIGAAPPMECGKGLSPGKQLREAGKRYSEKFPCAQGGIEASYELILATA